MDWKSGSHGTKSSTRDVLGQLPTVCGEEREGLVDGKGFVVSVLLMLVYIEPSI